MPGRHERLKRLLVAVWVLTGLVWAASHAAGRGTELARVFTLLTCAAWIVGFFLLWKFLRAEPNILAEVIRIPVDQVMGNSYRVRVVPDPASVEGLARSIENYGFVSPILVRPRGDKYELVIGERRLLAAKRLGRAWIPALVRHLSDKEMLEMSLLENVQRAPLNVVEEGRCFSRLAREFDMGSAKDLVDRLGLDPAWWDSRESLARLTEVARQSVLLGQITGEHALLLSQVADEPAQDRWLRRIVEGKWSVEETARRIREDPAPAQIPQDPPVQ